MNVISLFIKGQQALSEFVEIGGTQVLCEILTQYNINVNDRISVCELLITISNTGRKYKEIICLSGNGSKI